MLNWVHYLLQAGAEGRAPGDELLEGVNKYDLSASIIPFILGIVLFLNGRKWAHGLAQRDERNEQIEAAKAQETDTNA